MIPTALPIEDIARRLGGEVAGPTMVRAPAYGAAKADRSLVIIKSGAGLIVVPKIEGDDFRRMPAVKAAASDYVRSRLGEMGET